MDITTMTPTAALRSCSEPSFAVPSTYVPVALSATGMSADWHRGVAAAVPVMGLDVPTRTPMNDQHRSINRTARINLTTAKQAAPPRGEPR